MKTIKLSKFKVSLSNGLPKDLVLQYPYAVSVFNSGKKRKRYIYLFQNLLEADIELRNTVKKYKANGAVLRSANLLLTYNDTIYRLLADPIRRSSKYWLKLTFTVTL